MESLDKILKKANECLNCKNPICKEGCPIGTNIPEFITEIKKENFGKAYMILQENNIMSDICSNVCPYEQYCGRKCIKGIKGESVKIYELEKFVNKWAKENDIQYDIKILSKNNKKIAVIGAGPAGITCAVELAKKGFEVTIFEKENKLGGLLTYGIPDFRLPKKIIHDSIKNIISQAKIDVKINMELGKDITIENLKKEYDAIFLGIGTDISTTYKLSDEECSKIYKADYFLEQYNEKKMIENLGTVVVIGGGNVAFDSARAAKRMGADKVYIVYRKDKRNMPARQIEIEEALKDNIEIIYESKVINAEIKNNKLKEIKCIKTKIEENNFGEIENSEFNIKADTVVFAIRINCRYRITQKRRN